MFTSSSQTWQEKRNNLKTRDNLSLALELTSNLFCPIKEKKDHAHAHRQPRSQALSPLPQRRESLGSRLTHQNTSRRLDVTGIVTGIRHIS